MDAVQRIAEALAQKLGRPVAFDDPHMNLIAHTAHDGDVDRHRIVSVMQLRAPEEVITHSLSCGIATAVAPVRVPGLPDIDFLARACIPVRCQGLLLAYLWLIDSDGTLTDDELALATEAASAAGEVLLREQLLGDLRESRQRELVRDLLSDDAAVRESALGLLVDGEMMPSEGTLAALCVQVEDTDRDDVRTAIDSVLRTCGRRAQPLVSLALSRGGGQGVLILVGRRGPSEEQLESVAQDIRSELLRTLRLADGVRVGIGPSVAHPLDVGSSVLRAQKALAVSTAVEGFGPVTAWGSLGVYRLLIQLPLDNLIEDALPEGLRALIVADSGGPLVQTLETWLDEGCDPRATIARLQVHRTSLYYRLNRIEEITGMKLSDGTNRLALHLGLKLTRLQGR
jgi:DNA-binding PucR family transcriptional regulator